MRSHLSRVLVKVEMLMSFCRVQNARDRMKIIFGNNIKSVLGMCVAGNMTWPHQEKEGIKCSRVKQEMDRQTTASR